jgi:hypothetical protein
MEFNLDENFGARTAPIFREAGHDVETVADAPERLTRRHHLRRLHPRQRCLVTLDLASPTSCASLRI